jgi:hypothetical protein
MLWSARVIICSEDPVVFVSVVLVDVFECPYHFGPQTKPAFLHVIDFYHWYFRI